MAAPRSNRFQIMLQEAVQSVQWTYSLFWQICPKQGILIWGDGYYNGAIKTRKTVQSMEVSAKEVSLQRSQQLRELYDSLCSGETNQPTRRPCAALSPEDLTESEWFYLMCASFSFPPGVGLPGRAYSRRQHFWLTGAYDVDSKTFSRAILAKSARIQTVLCIPLLDGVVEFGTTERVQEDLGLVQLVKSFFTNHHHANTHPPKPALSAHSTSSPATSSEQPRLHSLPIPAMYTAVDPPLNANPEDEDDEEDDNEEEQEFDYGAETGRKSCQDGFQKPPVEGPRVAEPSELMHLEMSEDIRLGSPDDGSNNLDSDFHLLGVSQGGNLAYNQRRVDSFRAESNGRWPLLEEPITTGLQSPLSASEGPLPPLDQLTKEDTHYSQTVSTILQKQPTRWNESSSTGYVIYSIQSAFDKWTNVSDRHLPISVEGTSHSQWLLKYMLFSVPFLHKIYQDENSPTSGDTSGGDAASRFRKTTPLDELSANHVLAERRRREKLNERFTILRSLVPFVTKMDKSSILGDTIEYVKQLRKKVQALKTRNKQMEADQRSKMSNLPRTTSGSKDQRIGQTVLHRARLVSDKRKLRIVEGSSGSAKPKSVDSTTSVQVSIIESDALVELQCEYREGLLLDTLKMLRDMLIEVTAVQSSLTNGVFTAQLRAKVKDNGNGKKASIVEVKRAVHQIIPQC